MNFKFIAKNVGYYYKYLQARYGDRFETDEELLAVTGIMDAWLYVEHNQISIDEIVQAAYRSQHSVIVILPHSVNLYEGLEMIDRPVNKLLNFTLTLEALIFSADVPRMDTLQILLALKQQRPSVEKGIHAASAKPVPARIRSTVDQLLPKVDIIEIRAMLRDH